MRPQFDSWVSKIHWRRDRLPNPVFLGFPVAQLVKNPPKTRVDLGSIPRLERFPRGGKEYPLQYSGLHRLQSTGSQPVGHDWVTVAFILLQMLDFNILYVLNKRVFSHKLFRQLKCHYKEKS